MLGCVEVELSLKETAALIQQLCGANQNVEVRLWQKMTPDSDLYITENFPQEEKNDHMTKRYFYSEGEVPEYGIIIHLVKARMQCGERLVKFYFSEWRFMGFY